MTQIFIICGYGVPKDIATDGNYQHYLRGVFNRVYDEAQIVKNPRPVIVFAGGKTDIVKPFRRTESGEMARFFRGLMSRSSVRLRTKSWQILTESNSVSTLENFLMTFGLLKSRGIRSGDVTVFVEHTRAPRISRLVKRVAPKQFHCRVESIDFDSSDNRYLDPKFLAEKERRAERHDLWALRGEANLAEHHRLYRTRIQQLRRAGTAKQVAAIRKWWEQQWDLVEKKS